MEFKINQTRDKIMNKGIRKMGTYNHKKSWVLGLALSISPLCINMVLADTPSTPAPEPTTKAEGVNDPVAKPASKEAATIAQATSQKTSHLPVKPAIAPKAAKSSNQHKKNKSQIRIRPIDQEAIRRKPETPGMLHTLQTSLEAAYRNNTEIRELQAQARSSDEKVPQALAGWRPAVNLTASVAGSKEIDSGDTKNGNGGATTARTGVNSSRINAGVQLTQNLFNGGKTIATTCQAESIVQASRAGLADKEREILLAAVQAYVALIARHAELELRKSNEHTLLKTLEATQDRFNVGEETRTSIAQADASLADAVAKRQTAEAQVWMAAATFERVVGAPAGKLQKPEIPSNFPRTLKEAIDIAQKNNPGIQQALFQEKADRNNIKVNDADLLPKVDLQASSERQGISSRTNYPPGVIANSRTYDFSTVHTVSVNLTVPIYEQGKIRAQGRELRETAEFRRIQIETKRRRVIEELIQAWETYLSAKASVRNYQGQVKANEVALEGTRQELLVGSKILLDVLNAQQQLVNAQQNLVNEEQRYYQAAFTVLAQMGRLTALDMKLQVKRYDPQVHYQDVKYSF
jgi:outer membrane protein